MPEEYLEGRTTDPETWVRTPENLERFAAFTREANARRRAIEEREIPSGDQRRQETRAAAPAAPAARPGPGPGPPAVTARLGPSGGTGGEVTGPDAGTKPVRHRRDHAGAARVRGTASFEHGDLMVAPTLPLPHLSPAQRERLEQLAEAARLRAALYPVPKPPAVQRRSRSRQYPAGRASRRGTGRGRRRG
ncbi:hypothetical protein [Streptomyces sp. Root63]|uniref:hypothetical protein n=1 Tax=Streptomyces sp. Root63 TaxID=1736573 RepID=UPI000AAF0EAE|nr:hypothetical protein [Streptomyces sp. Root63]